jgi:hypothetical protein
MTKEQKTQNTIATVITGMFAVSMGFVIYRIITKAMNEPNEVEDTVSAIGYRTGRPSRSSMLGMNMRGGKATWQCRCGNSIYTSYVPCERFGAGCEEAYPEMS